MLNYLKPYKKFKKLHSIPSPYPHQSLIQFLPSSTLLSLNNFSITFSDNDLSFKRTHIFCLKICTKIPNSIFFISIF